MENKRVLLVYDSPLEKCNKLWLLRGLEKSGYQVEVFATKQVIFEVEQWGRFGEIIARLIVLCQAAKVILLSKPDDIILCWNHFSGLFANMISIFFRKRDIISYNWLSPTGSSRTKWLYKKALKNEKLQIVINSIDSKQQLLNCYGVKDINNIHYIPDVLDDDHNMQLNIQKHEDKYVFMGGVANRDWNLFIELALAFPNLTFIGVSTKTSWSIQSKIPENVKMYFDVEPEVYYGLMNNAYVVMCLLKEDKVSGLINILKATQLSKLLICSRISSSEIYFPKHCDELLVTINSLNDITALIDQVYKFSEEEYYDYVKQMQMHISKNFSPSVALGLLDEIIKKIDSDNFE